MSTKETQDPVETVEALEIDPVQAQVTYQWTVKLFRVLHPTLSVARPSTGPGGWLSTWIVLSSTESRPLASIA